jgi:hypothetical protein
MKEPWERPELVVLVRGRPEESVLIACKTANRAGPEDGQAQCNLPQALGDCRTCSQDART